MLRYFKYKIPFKKPFKTALGEFSDREGIVLAYEEKGIRAFGEVSPLAGFSDETLAQVETVLIQNKAFLSQAFSNDSADEIIQVLDQIHGFPSLSFGLDTLKYDLKAKRENKPLANLLFDTYSDEVLCNATAGMQSDLETLSYIEAKIKEGFGTLKLKVGQNFKSEKSKLEMVRKNFPDLKIRIDANQAWNADEAIINLNSIADLKIEYCEQPTPANDLTALKKVTMHTEINIAADESIGNKKRATEVITQNCCDLIILKPALIGLFDHINVTKALAESHDMEVVFTTLLDGTIGRTVTAILASGLGSKKYAHGLATGSLFVEDGDFRETLKKGAYHFSNSNGIGVPFDINSNTEII